MGRLTIRAFLMIWAASLFLACLVTSGAWWCARAKLRGMRDRILADVNGVDSGQILETEILGARREDLLWRATGDAQHRDVKEKHLLRAREIASTLRDHITTPREEEIAARIGRRMAALQAADTPAASVSLDELYGVVEGLLDAIHDYLKCNKSQLEETVEAAWQLHRLVDLWAVGVLVFVALLLVAGSWGLINRVVRPTMDLIQAASRSTSSRTRSSTAPKVPPSC